PRPRQQEAVRPPGQHPQGVLRHGADHQRDVGEESRGRLEVLQHRADAADLPVRRCPAVHHDQRLITVGLVGFGFAGQVFHAPVIRAVPGLRLTTIVRRSGERDARYPDVAFVRTMDELLARPIDLVVIATPQAIGADIRIERDGAAVDDAFDVTLHYPRMRAHLRGTMLASGTAPTFIVHGTQGSFIKYGMDPQEVDLKAGRTPDEPNWDVE